MKQIFNKMFLAGFFSLILLTNLGQTVMAAGTATMSMTPISGSYNNGDTIAVKIYEDSGADSVNTVQANFSYSAQLVSFVSFDFAGSAFGVAAQADSSTPGLIKIGRGQIGVVTGNAFIGTVNFKVIKSAGPVDLNFDTTKCLVVRSDNNQPETLTFQNASYTITAPVTPPTPTPTPSPAPTPNPTPSPSPSPTNTQKTTTKTTTKSPSVATPAAASAPTLTISDILVQNVSGTTATITWTTSLPATSNIDYGPSTNYIFSSSDGSVGTTHSVTLDSKNLNPNSTYHYRVSSVDATGKVATGPDSTFTTDDTKAIAGFGSSLANGIKSSAKLIAAAVSVMALALLAFVAAIFVRHMHSTALLGAHGSYTPASAMPPINKIPENAIIIGGGPRSQPKQIPVSQPPQSQPSVASSQKLTNSKANPSADAKQPAKPVPPEPLVVFADNPEATIKPQPKAGDSDDKPPKT